MAESTSVKRLAVNNGEKDFTVPVLGFGAMGITAFYGGTEDIKSAEAVTTQAVKAGLTFVDTADFYGGTSNLDFLGNTLSQLDEGTRAKVQLAVKTGAVFGKPTPKYPHNDISPEYIRGSVEDSCKRLQVDSLDVLFIARIPAAVEEEDLKALADTCKELKASGKVRGIGLSEVPASMLRRFHAMCPVSFLESEYSLMVRQPETNGLFDACKELGIVFVAYGALWRGGLSSTFDPAALKESDFRLTGSTMYSGENWKANKAIVDALAEVAKKKGITLPQLAIAWVLRQSQLMTIVGMRSPERLEENLQALSVTFSEEEVKEIDSIAPVGKAKGDRYLKPMLDAWGVE